MVTWWRLKKTLNFNVVVLIWSVDIEIRNDMECGWIGFLMARAFFNKYERVTVKKDDFVYQLKGSFRAQNLANESFRGDRVCFYLAIRSDAYEQLLA